MHPIPLTPQELQEHKPGEAISLATVMLIFTIAILAIAAYKLFFSNEGKVTLPGGYKFEWDK